MVTVTWGRASPTGCCSACTGWGSEGTRPESRSKAENTSRESGSRQSETPDAKAPQPKHVCPGEGIPGRIETDRSAVSVHACERCAQASSRTLAPRRGEAEAAAERALTASTSSAATWPTRTCLPRAAARSVASITPATEAPRSREVFEQAEDEPLVSDVRSRPSVSGGGLSSSVVARRRHAPWLQTERGSIR